MEFMARAALANARDLGGRDERGRIHGSRIMIPMANQTETETRQVPS